MFLPVELCEELPQAMLTQYTRLAGGTWCIRPLYVFAGRTMRRITAGHAHSVHTFGGRHVVHLVIHWLVTHRTVSKDHLSIFNMTPGDPGDGVLHPLLIVAIWEVLMCLCTTRLLAVFGPIHLLAGLVEQVLELHRLDEVCVPDQTAVGNTDILIFPHDINDKFFTFHQILGISVDRRMLLHHDLEFTPQFCRRDWALGVTHLIQTGNCLLARIGWERHRWAVWLHKFGCGICCLPAEHNQIK